jgi:hypothetical protein
MEEIGTAKDAADRELMPAFGRLQAPPTGWNTCWDARSNRSAASGTRGAGARGEHRAVLPGAPAGIEGKLKAWAALGANLPTRLVALAPLTGDLSLEGQPFELRGGPSAIAGTRGVSGRVRGGAGQGAGRGVPDRGAHVALPGTATVMEKLAADWDGWTAHDDTYVVDGEKVVVLARYAATSKATGTPIDLRVAHHSVVRGGLMPA